MIADLAMHLADLVQNSLRAGARSVGITLARRGDSLFLEVTDDGAGIPEDLLSRVTDPFFSTKPGARVGLGIPLLVQTAEETGGECRVEGREGGGTRVWARLGWDHPDRPPLGDLPGTLVPLLATHPEVEFTVELRDDRAAWTLSTRELREHLGEVPLTHPDVLRLMERELEEGLAHMGWKEER